MSKAVNMGRPDQLTPVHPREGEFAMSVIETVETVDQAEMDLVWDEQPADVHRMVPGFAQQEQ